MQYDGFDYFTMHLRPNGSSPISLTTESGSSKSSIIINGNAASIEVDYAHRPVFIIRREKETTITNRHRDLKAVTKGMRPNIELVKRFVEHGQAMIPNVPFHGVECIAPSSRINVAEDKISTERYQMAPPGEPLSGTEAVERAIVESLAERLKRKKCAFALSGGVDSTLLTALAKRHQICEVTAYTAKTGAGQDLLFARAAARSLGVKLVEVEVPFTKRQLEIHRVLTDVACGPIKTKVGFTMVCMAAKADGFEGIVDGTGPEPIFGGNYKNHGVYWAAEQLRLGNSGRVEKFINFGLSHKLIDRSTVAKIKKLAEEEISFRDFSFDRFTKGRLRVFQRVRSIGGAAADMEVIMPYFDHALGHYLLNDGSGFFENGRNKSALRKILSKYVPLEIAYRTDKQGLRWSTKLLVKTLGSEMKKKIRESELLNQLNNIDKLKIIAKLDRDIFSRCYAAVIFLELCAGRNLDKKLPLLTQGHSM